MEGDGCSSSEEGTEEMLEEMSELHDLTLGTFFGEGVESLRFLSLLLGVAGVFDMIRIYCCRSQVLTNGRDSLSGLR